MAKTKVEKPHMKTYEITVKEIEEKFVVEAHGYLVLNHSEDISPHLTLFIRSANDYEEVARFRTWVGIQEL